MPATGKKKCFETYKAEKIKHFLLTTLYQLVVVYLSYRILTIFTLRPFSLDIASSPDARIMLCYASRLNVG